jgi:hypothetical protein
MPAHLPRPDLRARLEELCGLLDSLAGGLVAVDADALLAIESPLSRAVDDIRTALTDGSSSEGLPPAVRALALRAKASLRRCEMLGLSFATATRVAGDAAGSYGRSGAFVRPAIRPALRVVT